MKTIEIREFKDRNGRLWVEVPSKSSTKRLRHEFPPNLAPAPAGWPLQDVEVEHEVVEYLVGPLVEV